MHTGAGEWIWRPLRAPRVIVMTTFPDNNIKRFRPRAARPRFRPLPGHRSLLRDAPDLFRRAARRLGRGPDRTARAGDQGRDGRQYRHLLDAEDRAGAAQGLHLFLPHPRGARRRRPVAQRPRRSTPGRASPKALGSNEAVDVGSRRFIVDFAGGDLAYYRRIRAWSRSSPRPRVGKILRTILQPNPHINGFRAMIDVEVEPGQSTDIRAFLRTPARTRPDRNLADAVDRRNVSSLLERGRPEGARQQIRER